MHRSDLDWQNISVIDTDSAREVVIVAEDGTTYHFNPQMARVFGERLIHAADQVDYGTVPAYAPAPPKYRIEYHSDVHNNWVVSGGSALIYTDLAEAQKMVEYLHRNSAIGLTYRRRPSNGAPHVSYPQERRRSKRTCASSGREGTFGGAASEQAQAR